MSKKGQALVEFVIIMPIFIMLVLGVMDIGKIMYSKITLEEQVSDVISLYQNGNNKEEIALKLKLNDDNIVLNINDSDENTDFELIKKVDIITPGLNLIFNNPYDIKVTRSILNDVK